MRRITIHLGLPKTATTSLQKHIFSQLPGYLGQFTQDHLYPSTVHVELRDLYVYGTMLDGRRVYEVDGRPVWIPALSKWVEEVVASKDETLFWSLESLSQWRSPADNAAVWPVMTDPGALPRRGRHPIVGFLQHLSSLLPQDIELKTILTLRNQSDWLISLAAEMGISDSAFVERLILSNDASLDYYGIIRDLEHLRGPENHLTLLFENGMEHNAQQILSFAGYSPRDFRDFGVSRARENVRRSEAGWSVKRLSPHAYLEQRLRSTRERFPLLDKLLRSTETLRRPLHPYLGFEARQRALGGIPARQVQIFLTEEQKAAIRTHCETSNARLGAHLDEDLRSLGY